MSGMGTIEEYDYSVREVRKMRSEGITSAISVAAFTRRITFRQMCRLLRSERLSWMMWCRSLGVRGEPHYIFASLEEAMVEDHLQQAGMVAMGITDPTRPCSRRVIVERRWPWRRVVIEYTDPFTDDQLELVIQQLPYWLMAKRIRQLWRYMPPPASL